MSVKSNEISKKLIIMGIDKSGKTAILETLREGLVPSSLASMKPTEGAKMEEIAIDGDKIVVWEFGGQKNFRNEYFKRKEYYFSYVDTIIYVIDVQNPERYDESIEYFKNIVNVVKMQKLVPNFIIFIHKFDPDLPESMECRKHSQELTQRIESILTPLRIKARIHETSIYTNLRRIDFLK